MLDRTLPLSSLPPTGSLEGEEVEVDQSPQDASPSSPKSFQALYTQAAFCETRCGVVAQLLQELQAAHQQEMAQPQELGRRRKPKLRAHSEKRKKAKNVGILPNVLEVKMAANEEVEEKGLPQAEHVHIGCPSKNPISLQKLHGMMQGPDANQEARPKYARLSSVNSFAGFADYCSGQAKSLMDARSMTDFWKGTTPQVAKLEETANLSPREKCRSRLNGFVRSTSFKALGPDVDDVFG
eukprot:symbB.v1.2.022679.t1/scaffold2025.1/size93651/2